MISSKISLATVAAIALATNAMAGAARAAAVEPAFDAFAGVCGRTAADFGAVSAASTAQGWGASDVAPDASLPGVTLSNQMTKATTAGKQGLVLSAWTGATQKGVKVSDCAVHVAGTDFEALRTAAASWLSFAPAETTAKKVVFRFTDTGGSHRALTAGEYDAAAGATGLQILTISGDANGTVLDLMMIKK